MISWKDNHKTFSAVILSQCISILKSGLLKIFYFCSSWLQRKTSTKEPGTKNWNFSIVSSDWISMNNLRKQLVEFSILFCIYYVSIYLFAFKALTSSMGKGIIHLELFITLSWFWASTYIELHYNIKAVKYFLYISKTLEENTLAFQKRWPTLKSFQRPT